MKTPLILPLQKACSLEQVGGKAFHLHQMKRQGHPVPKGWVIPTSVFESFIKENGLQAFLDEQKAALDLQRPESFQQVSQAIQERIQLSTIPTSFRSELDTFLQTLPKQTLWIVRSSGVGEDSKAASFAGQLTSITHIKEKESIVEAILKCWGSYWSQEVLFYQQARELQLQGMGVIIQEMIEPILSGVLFTRYPANAEGQEMMAEFCYGHAEALVSGKMTPGKIIFSRRGSFWQKVAEPMTLDNLPQKQRKPIPPVQEKTLLTKLWELAIALEHHYGCPQDLEWAVSPDFSLYLVQTRPITSLPSSTNLPAVQSANKTPPNKNGLKYPVPQITWSNANMRENYPEPITPLLYSVAQTSYKHYFRNLGRAFGVSEHRIQAMEQPLRSIVGIHNARLYYNLSSIHTCLKAAPFGEQLTSYWNAFVGVEDDARAQVPSSVKGLSLLKHGESSLEVLKMGLKSASTFSQLDTGVRKFEKRVDAFAQRCHPKTMHTKPLHLLFKDFQSFLAIRFHQWTDASLADAATTISSGLLKAFLSKMAQERSSEQEHDMPEQSVQILLEGLPDLVSLKPIQGLWELSRQIQQKPLLRTLFSQESPKNILIELREDKAHNSFFRSFERYLEKWGFRSPGELMLTYPNFQERPEDLLAILKGYAQKEGPSPLELTHKQRQKRKKLTQKLLQNWSKEGFFGAFRSWSQQKSFLQFLAWTHKAIALRERARLKQSLLYSRFRCLIKVMSQKLLERGTTECEDALFFLTYQEIESLLSGNSMYPGGIASLVTLRKEQHQMVTQHTPADSITLVEGEYLQPTSKGGGKSFHVDSSRDMKNATLQEQGKPASKGQVEEIARVICSLSEAHKLQPGDILVTKQTDPGWGPLFFLSGGLLMEHGGLLSHGAIIAREFGIPAVIGIPHITKLVKDGRKLSLDGDTGWVRQ